MTIVPDIDFLVIGAYKSGTSTTRAMLDAHPDVFVTGHKEPNFLAFCDPDDSHHPDGAPNPAWRPAVRSWDDWHACYSSRGDAVSAGEVSPEYLTSTVAAARIAHHLPHVRLVAVLRNPVERAYSDYLMYVRDGVERDDFATALDRQDERYRAGSGTGYYLRTGCYHDQLARYLERFPREQLLVLLQEELRHDPAGSAGRLFDHIGVRTDVDVTDTEDRNVSGVPTSVAAKVVYRARTALRPALGGVVPEALRQWVDQRLRSGLTRPDIDGADRARLVEYYRDDVERLGHLLDIDLTHWIDAES